MTRSSSSKTGKASDTNKRKRPSSIKSWSVDRGHAQKPSPFKKLNSRRHSNTSDNEYGDEDEDDDEPEQEINTIQDYENSVRQRRLHSSTDRYDDRHRDLLTTASAIMDRKDGDDDDDVDGGGGLVGEKEFRNQNKLPSLATFCVYKIVQEFHHLAVARKDGTKYKDSFAQIQSLPFYISEKLFRILRQSRPEILASRIWTNLFFPVRTVNEISHHSTFSSSSTGFSTTITSLDLEGILPSEVTGNLLHAHFILNNLTDYLETINFNYLDQLSDSNVERIIKASPSLVRLKLKGCTKVGDLTLLALPGHQLEELHISFVASPTANGLKHMIQHCRQLTVLKMAGLVNIRDNWILELQKQVQQEQEQDQERDDSEVAGLPLYRLQNLKISNTKLGDRGLKVLLSWCGKTLERLDISATQVTKVAVISQSCVWKEEEEDDKDQGKETKNQTRLEKINLTRLNITSPTDLVNMFKLLPPNSLHTILMGYLTCGQIPASEELLDKVRPYLKNAPPATTTTMATKARGVEGGLFPRYDYSNNSRFTPTVTMNVFNNIHTLSLFGNPRIGTSKTTDRGLYILLSTLARTLKRLELGFTRCESMTLVALVDDRGQGVNRNSNAEGEEDEEGEDEADYQLNRLNWFKATHDTESDVVYLGDQQPPTATGTATGAAALINGALTYNSVLEELGLDETLIDDDVGIVIGHFKQLHRLTMANTRVGTEAVAQIVRGCSVLKSLDLTSCRSIPLLRRRTLLHDIRSGKVVMSNENDDGDTEEQDREVGSVSGGRRGRSRRVGG